MLIIPLLTGSITFYEYSKAGQPAFDALAHSKPVVGSDIDSIAEILNNSNARLLFKTGDPEDLAAKMATILDMRHEDVAKMGLASRGLIRVTYTENIVFHDWFRLLRPYLK